MKLFKNQGQSIHCRPFIEMIRFAKQRIHLPIRVSPTDGAECCNRIAANKMPPIKGRPKNPILSDNRLRAPLWPPLFRYPFRSGAIFFKSNKMTDGLEIVQQNRQFQQQKKQSKNVQDLKLNFQTKLRLK